MNAIARFFILALLAGTLMRCNDPTSLGSDLLDEDSIPVSYIDTMTVLATTIWIDSLRVYDGTTNGNFVYMVNAPFGALADPVFGQADARVYSQIRVPIDGLGLPREPAFKRPGTVLDSMVLVLPYNVAGTYGDVQATFGMEVRRLDEAMDAQQVYYSDQELATLAMPLATVQFTPSFDSVSVVDFDSGSPDTVLLPPHLRIPLDMAFAQEVFMEDSLTFTNDSTFKDFFKGYELRSTQTTPGMLSFNMSTTLGGIYMYYTQDDTLPMQYHMPTSTSTVRSTRLEHDYSGTGVEEAIGSGLSDSDSLLYAQGLAGVSFMVKIPALQELEDVIVNKAELEFTLAQPAGDDPSVYLPADQIIVSFRNSDGRLVVVDDIQRLNRDPNLPNPLAYDQDIYINDLLPSAVFGGDEEKGANGATSTYKVSLSAHVQKIIEGTVSDGLYISIHPKPSNARRLVFYGPGHDLHPPKFRLTLTRY